MQELISIVVPMYFEQEVAEECYKRLTDVVKANHLKYELIFVNDGSKDNTMKILEDIADRDTNVKIISFSRNFGHQIAVTAGIDRAQGDAVIIIDADLQDPPELIPEMIERWKEGYDVVYAKRKKRDGETWLKLLTAKCFYRLLHKMTNIEIPVDTGDFRLIDRKVAEVFRCMPEKNRFVRGMVSWLGFKQIPIEYERKERFAGSTKYPLKKMMKFALDGIFSFSCKPVKLIESMGVLSILTALGILLFSLFSRLSGNTGLTSGWASIMTGITFIGGVQLLSVGILGEYISRVYDESRKRPLYVVDKEVNLLREPAAQVDPEVENRYEENIRKAI